MAPRAFRPVLNLVFCLLLIGSAEAALPQRIDITDAMLVSSGANEVVYYVPVTPVDADTIAAHMRIQTIGNAFNPDQEMIRFEVVGADPNHPVEWRYTTDNPTGRDVGFVHDSIYIGAMSTEIEGVRIILESEAQPRILVDSWIEIRKSTPVFRMVTLAGTHNADPADGTNHRDRDRQGYLGQFYIKANGMSVTRREKAKVRAFSTKMFHPMPVSFERRADMRLRVSWAGTADKNEMMVFPFIGISGYEFEVRAGICHTVPWDWDHGVAGCKGQRVARMGESSYPFFEGDFVQGAIWDVSCAALTLINPVAGLACEAVGSAMDIVEALVATGSVDAATWGHEYVFFNNVPFLNTGDRGYAWIGVAALAEAGGTATSYVNFMYDGDPFYWDDHVDNDNKGLWIHDVLIYYQPLELPRVRLGGSSGDLNWTTPINMSAIAEKGTAPFSYEWKRMQFDNEGNVTDEVVMRTCDTTCGIDDYYTTLLDPGRYRISVELTDREGLRDTDMVEVEVMAPPDAPTLSISHSTIETDGTYFIEWTSAPTADDYIVWERKGSDPWLADREEVVFKSFWKETAGTYQYYVEAVDRLSQKTSSNTVAIEVVNPPGEPPVMTEMEEEQAAGLSYGVQWQKVEAVPAVGYALREYTWTTDASGVMHRDELSEQIFPGCPDVTGTPPDLFCNVPGFSHDPDEVTSYEYEVTTRSNVPPFSESAPSNTESTAVYPPPTGTPTLIEHTHSVSQDVNYKLEWVDQVPDAMSYCLEQDTSPGFVNCDGEFSPIRCAARICGTEFETPGLTKNIPSSGTTTYYYRLAGENRAGIGPWSTPVSKTVTVGVLPSAPVLTTSAPVVQPGEEFTLEWSHVDAEDSYCLEESFLPDFGGSPPFCQFPFLTPANGLPTTSTTFTRVWPDTRKYYYRVWGTTPGLGEGPLSNVVEVQVLGIDAPPPPVIHNPELVTLPGRPYTISWEEVPGAVSYRLQEGWDAVFETITNRSLTTPETSYVIDWHDPNTVSVTTDLYYRVKVEIDALGYTSGWSKAAVKQLSTPDCAALGLSPPSTPLNLRAEPPTVYSEEAFRVLWDPAPGAVDYEVGRDYGVDGVWGCDGWIDTYLGATAFFDTNEPMDMSVDPDQKGVCYWVKAWNACGSSPLSAALTVKCATWYEDNDGDTFGDPNTALVSCENLGALGWVRQGEDCDDYDFATYPLAPQYCDGVNTDCYDGSWPLPPPTEMDHDGDTYPECLGDCDESDGRVYPDAPQDCDGVNNDCNDPGWPSVVGTNELDDDGDGLSECQADCDDGEIAVYPDAPEICDGINNDCNDPGWPAPSSTEVDGDVDGFMPCEGDCDDGDVDQYPAAPQLCGDGMNNDCDHASWPGLTGTNEWDDDTDGLSECAGDCDDGDQFVWSVPGETQDLELISSIVLQWVTPTAPGCTTPLYDTLRATDPVVFTAPTACVVSNIAGSTTIDPQSPNPGQIFYYLVRAEDSCGLGPLGDSSGGQPRTGHACP